MYRFTRAGMLLAACALTPAARAQDVMTVAKDQYKVLVENEYVRVVENTLPPGTKDPMHTHPSGRYCVTVPGRMRVVFATGKNEIWEPAAGESGWMAAEGPHTSENVGVAAMTDVLVEVKGVRSAATAGPHASAPRRPLPTGRGSR